MVTGATGLVGSHLVDRLVREGRFVRALVRPSSRLTWLTPHVQRGRAEIVTGDLSDAGLIDRICRNVDTVYHTAAAVDFSLGEAVVRSVNIDAVRILAASVLKNRVRRMIHLSSIGACRWGSEPIDESTPLEAVNVYEATKMEGDRFLLAAHERQGLPVVVLAPSAIYGPRARIVIPEMLWYLRKGWMPLVDGGRRRLNMVHVSDVVEAMILAARVPKAVGRRFLIGHTESPTFRRIFEVMAGCLGISPPFWSVPGWAALPAARLLTRLEWLRAPFPLDEYMEYATRDAVLDISRARKVLGYEPRVNLAEGMASTIEWFVRQSPEWTGFEVLETV